MKSHRRSTPPSGQRGVALIVVLVLLLAVTGIAIFSARNATVSEGVARNQLDAEVARQAAEAALRDAERDILLPTGTLVTNALCPRNEARPIGEAISQFTVECPKGQCGFAMSYYDNSNWATPTASTAEPWWPASKNGLWNDDADSKPRRGSGGGPGVDCDFDGGVPLGTYTGTAPIAGVARQPEYLIEYMRRGRDNYFRITARGFGYTTNSQVVLQSYFKPFPTDD